MKRRGFGLLVAVAAAMMAVGLWLAVTAPPDAMQGNFARIFHVHVPSAWLAFLAFGITALGSIGWLVRRTDGWDLMAESSAEIGVVFTAIALFTGSLWGRPVWGTYWDWGDKRLASTALMFFVYLGYLALRRATPDRVQRARRSAVLGVVAVIQVPLVYFSVDLWRTLHPKPSIRPTGATMPAEMLRAFLINLAAFTVMYLAMLIGRMRLARSLMAAEQQTLPAAGTAVTAPKLEAT